MKIRHAYRSVSTVFAFALAIAIALVLASSSQAATSVGLGAGDSFAVLAGAGVTNTEPSVVNGDLGTSPTPAVTGFGGAPNGTVNGSIHQADTLAGQAKGDLVTAYNDAAGQGPANNLATELGGQALTPGVYDSEAGTFGITGTLTLNAQGNPDAVFIFQMASTLITASSSQVSLINGAQPCNVFWQVGSSATLGTSSVFAGNILALESISLDSGVTVNGRLLARTGAVTLINDTITRADCAGDGGDDGGGGGGDGDGGGDDGDAGGGGSDGGEAGGGSVDGSRNDLRQGPRRGNRNRRAARPRALILGVPGAGRRPRSRSRRARCVDAGFRANFRIRSRGRLRRVKVFVAGRQIRQTRRKRFSVWVKVGGLRAGRNIIRVVAVDRNGRRDVAIRSFRRCARAAPTPKFTG